MPFSPVEAPNLANSAADQIRQLIAVDILRPGDSLPGERELAERMKISRTSVRAALKTLIAEGLLVSRHGAGLKVSENLGNTISDPLIHLLSHSPGVIGDYLDFRGIIESECAAEAADHANRGEREQIQRAHEAMLQAIEEKDLAKAAKADVEFHMSIVEATGNVVSIQINRCLHTLLTDGVERSHRIISEEEDAWSELARQHEQILEAIDNKDANAARDTMRAHLSFQHELIQRQKSNKKRMEVSEKRKMWNIEKDDKA